MKTNYLIFSIMITSFWSFGQNPNIIKYVFPDVVESVIDSSFNKTYELNHDFRFYLFLGSDSAVYSLTIGTYTTKGLKNISNWIKRTTRYAVVGDRLIPLIFDYDNKFSTYRGEIGTFGRRDTSIIRSELIMEGTTIYFDKNGKFIKRSN